jgi:hypothetical protein
LLAELLPGQAKKDITPMQAKGMLASVRPRGTSFSTHNQPPWLVKMSIRITCITSMSGSFRRPESGTSRGT